MCLNKRRRRDLNPRAAINDLLPFQGSPFSLLGTSPKSASQKLFFISLCKKPPIHIGGFQRRGWDSNPRALSDKRFSRPPRYDHFDTSAHIKLLPHLFRDVTYSIMQNPHCQHFFYFIFTTFFALFQHV